MVPLRFSTSHRQHYLLRRWQRIGRGGRQDGPLTRTGWQFGSPGESGQIADMINANLHELPMYTHKQNVHMYTFFEKYTYTDTFTYTYA